MDDDWYFCEYKEGDKWIDLDVLFSAGELVADRLIQQNQL